MSVSLKETIVRIHIIQTIKKNKSNNLEFSLHMIIHSTISGFWKFLLQILKIIHYSLKL